MRNYLIDYISNSKWLIEQSVLQKSLPFVEKALFNPELINNDKKVMVDEQGYRQGRDLFIRDEIAIIDITGPIFRYSQIQVCAGPTQSTQTISEDLRLAEENPKIKAVILNMDTPGGDARGISELADQIKNYSKPIVTYGGGTIASAGYWIASATNKIYASNTSFIGSIGAVIEFDITKPSEGTERIQIVSKVSPNKRIDPLTDAGKQQLQDRIDELGTIFVESVADNRSITFDKVIENYGQGSTFIAGKALEQGLIDEVSTLESVIADMKKEISLKSGLNNGVITPLTETENGGQKSMAKENANTDEPVVAETVEPQTDVEAAKTEAAGAALATNESRMADIKQVFESKGLSNHPKMIDLLMNSEAGKMEALEECCSILMESGKTESLADKELKQRAGESAVLDDVQASGAPDASETSGTLNMAAFSAGFKSVSAVDMG